MMQELIRKTKFSIKKTFTYLILISLMVSCSFNKEQNKNDNKDIELGQIEIKKEEINKEDKKDYFDYFFESFNPLTEKQQDIYSLKENVEIFKPEKNTATDSFGRKYQRRNIPSLNISLLVPDGFSLYTDNSSGMITLIEEKNGSNINLSIFSKASERKGEDFIEDEFYKQLNDELIRSENNRLYNIRQVDDNSVLKEYRSKTKVLADISNGDYNELVRRPDSVNSTEVEKLIKYRKDLILRFTDKNSNSIKRKGIVNYSVIADRLTMVLTSYNLSDEEEAKEINRIVSENISLMDYDTLDISNSLGSEDYKVATGTFRMIEGLKVKGVDERFAKHFENEDITNNISDYLTMDVFNLPAGSNNPDVLDYIFSYDEIRDSIVSNSLYFSPNINEYDNYIFHTEVKEKKQILDGFYSEGIYYIYDSDDTGKIIRGVYSCFYETKTGALRLVFLNSNYMPYDMAIRHTDKVLFSFKNVS